MRRYYRFITDFNVVYTVSFVEDDLLASPNCYQFIITNTNNKKSPRDPKLRDTIIAIIHEFFNSSQNILLYICETGDAKQSMRNRLFEIWFKASARRSEFAFFSAHIKDAEGILNYATLITRLDNPELRDIVSEFTTTIQALSQKPE